MNLDDISEERLNRAVAIYYDGQRNPVLVAKGRHQQAEDIVASAKASEVPVYNNDALARMLEEMEIGEHIPAELYRAVACVLCFAYRDVMESDAS